MLEFNECLRARSAVTHLQIVDNNLLFTTKIHGMKAIALDECSTKINLSNRNLNSDTNAVAISPNGKLLAFANESILYVVDITTHKTLQTIQTQSNFITKLIFDASSEYIISGDKNGRVLQYKYNSSLSLARLCSFPYQKPLQKQCHNNFVSALATYDNLIASSGFGGGTIIIDIHSRANKQVIKETKIHSNALYFLDQKRLLNADVNGDVHIISLNNKTAYRKISTTLRNIQQIVVTQENQYALISSENNTISLIDLVNFKLLEKQYLSFESNILNMTIHKSHLIVALSNSKIITLELADKKKLNSLILHNSIDEAYKLVETFPMLENTHEHHKLEQLYKNAFSKAVDAIINNNKDFAMQTINSFKNVKSKRHEIETLFVSFKNYNRFQALVLEKKYALAYAMTAKFPAFIYTPPYKKMESIWKKSFGDAQRQMVQGRTDVAKAILNEYATTTIKRPLIKFVLNHNKTFLKFLKAIENKEFKEVYSLVKENDIFAQIPNYIKLNRELNKNIDDAREYIKVGKLDNANKCLNMLQNIPHFSDEVIFLEKESLAMAELQKAYKEKHFSHCYEILDKTPSLHYTQLSQLLEESWNKLIYQCETYALQGDLKGVQKTLSKLISVPTRTDKIGDLLRVSYASRIRGLLSQKKYKKAERLIYAYIDTFGKDSEITFCKRLFEKVSNIKLALQEDQFTKKSRNYWLRSLSNN